MLSTRHWVFGPNPSCAQWAWKSPFTRLQRQNKRALLRDQRHFWRLKAQTRNDKCPTTKALVITASRITQKYDLLFNLSINGVFQPAAYSLGRWLLMSLPSRQLALRRLEAPHVFLISCTAKNPIEMVNNDNRTVSFQFDYLQYMQL